MAVTLSADQKSHLALLLSQEHTVIGEFCRLGAQYLRKGVTPKVFNNAAAKLGVESSKVENAVHALIFLLLESIRTHTTITAFKETVLMLGFSEDTSELMSEFYSNSSDELQHYVQDMKVKVQQYHDLEWRFDIMADKRSIHNIAAPVITIGLHYYEDTSEKNVNMNNSSKRVLLQTDPNTLLFITEKLEEALQEVRSHNFRWLMKLDK
ncbi:COMM domain-containing protein 2 [Oratosquilla oratoria]|uniref:COMM domain-containing protein 2 n=1 Tax=Oratosquilla oratoria TaxID=337810 RepID=UPI003F757861